MTRLTFCTLVFLATSSAYAGTEVIKRKEFRQDTVYPYVFRPVPYLVSAEGPVPMRIAAPGPECGHRSPPALPVVQTIIEDTTAVVPTPEVMASQQTQQQTIEVPGIVQQLPLAPQTKHDLASLPAEEGVNFSKIPPEVLDYFENPNKGQPNFQYRFFDPIFQPAFPQKLPESKVSYRVE